MRRSKSFPKTSRKNVHTCATRAGHLPSEKILLTASLFLLGDNTNLGDDVNDGVDANLGDVANKGIEVNGGTLEKKKKTKKTKQPSTHKKEGKILTLNVC